MLEIDKIAYTNKLTKVNPSIKFTFVIVILITAIIIENIPMYIGMFLTLAFVLILFAGITPIRYLKLFLIPASFLFLSILTILLSFSKTPKDFIIFIPIASIYLGISQSALSTCTILFFRSLACLSSTYFMALTIPMNQMLKLLKTIHMPIVVIEMVMLIYRFIMMFLEEYNEMQTALYLKFGYGNLRTSYRSIALLIVNLFTRMMNRYSEMNTSLEVKLYNGNFHV